MSRFEFDENEFPPAYFISFRCYGTWLHGDARKSMDGRKHNIYGMPPILPNAGLKKFETGECKYPSMTLDAARRAIVEKAIREVCEHRDYQLLAINVRSNHVHTVVSANCKPEPVMNAFKAYSTRCLRQADTLSSEARFWSRHGSTRYLWKPRQIEFAVDYVINGRGDELPKFD